MEVPVRDVAAARALERLVSSEFLVQVSALLASLRGVRVVDLDDGDPCVELGLGLECLAKGVVTPRAHLAHHLAPQLAVGTFHHPGDLESGNHNDAVVFTEEQGELAVALLDLVLDFAKSGDTRA